MTIDEEMDWIGKNNALISKTDEANVDRIVRNAIGTAAADFAEDKVLEKAGMFDELVGQLIFAHSAFNFHNHRSDARSLEPTIERARELQK